MSKEETFPIPLKCIDVTRTTRTKLDVLQESRIDNYWNVAVDRSSSGSWTKCKTSKKDILWSGSRLTKIRATSRPDSMWPEIWSGTSNSSTEEGGARMGYCKTKARQCAKIEEASTLLIPKMECSRKPLQTHGKVGTSNGSGCAVQTKDNQLSPQAAGDRQHAS